MKLAVTAAGGDLDSPVDPRFGRCSYFILIDPQTLAFEAFANPFVDRQGGAGIQAGKLMVEKGVSAVLTGRCGPNAQEVLDAAGVRIVPDCAGTVRSALERFTQAAPAAAQNCAVAPNPAPADESSSEPARGGRGPCGMGLGRGRGQGRRPRQGGV